jgi:CRP-like cAMP-binding protein
LTFKVPFFKEFKYETLLKMCEHLEAQVFDQGSMLMREGDPGDCLYIIVSGSVEVMRLRAVDSGGDKGISYEEIHMATLGPGQCVGENAIHHSKITRAKRSATVIANTEQVLCLRL